MLALPLLSRSESSPAAFTNRQLPGPAVHPRRKPSTTHLPWAPYHRAVKRSASDPSSSSSSLLGRVKSVRPSRVLGAVVSLGLVMAFVLLCASVESSLMGPSKATLNATTARAMMSGGAMGRSLRNQASGTEYGAVLKSPSANAPRLYKPVRSLPTASSSSSHSGYVPLTPQEELASLIDFLTSHRSHSLPLDVNSDVPLLPDSILDVNLPTDTTKRAEVLAEVGQECWDRWPVVIIGSTKATAKARTLLKHESLLGTAAHGLAFLETNLRADTSILLPILSRLTGIPSTSPIVLIGGLPYSLAEFEGIYKDGWLQQLLGQAGAKLGEQQRKREHKEKLMKAAMAKIKITLAEEDDLE